MAKKNSKWPIYCDFSHFTSIILPCGRDNLKSFLRILFNFVMHVTNNQFSDKFNNGWKKIQNGQFIVIFRIYAIIYLVAAIMTSSLIMAAGYCGVCSCYE